MAYVKSKNGREGWLWKVAVFLLAALAAKLLFSILYQYRWYFPADFESSAFLTGRQAFFQGSYRFAFYAHIVTGPVAIILAFLLMASGGRSRFRKTHRFMGRALILLVVVVVAPSGLVMSTRTFTGAIAGVGFAMLSAGTAVTAIVTGFFARRKEFDLHQRWATRCFIFLCSPLILRLMTGGAIALGIESPLTYRISAWLSWLMPLVIFEIWLFAFRPDPFKPALSESGRADVL